ncbi:MAG: phytanoyl-CoA dioxygenase family protein [Alphaproteobacteria bacterium]|nr:phytanoyl-CoA dioxygenase family protein [Alphaproteobacteria bacterium]
MAALNVLEASATAEAIAGMVDEDGYAIVRGLLPDDELAALRGELDPLIATTEGGSEAFMGHKTKRFGALLGRCPTSRRMVTDPLMLAIADRVLLPYCARYQIGYTGIMHLEPGEKAQPLHRDTGLYPFHNPAPPLILATMWAVSDFTAKNGATCLVPGSHRWTDDRVPLPDEIVAAEMSAGSVLLYTGNVLHGGGANRANGARTGVALQYSLGWLRQEENQYMAMPIEQARQMPRQLQELMGYALATVNLGFVDHKDPNEVLNGTAGAGPGTLGADALMAADAAIRRIRVAETSIGKRPRFHVEGRFADPS